MMAVDFPGIHPALPLMLAEIRDSDDQDWPLKNAGRYQEICIAPCLDLITTLKEKLALMSPSHQAVAEIGGSLRARQNEANSSSGNHPSYLHLVFWAGQQALTSPTLHLVLSSAGIGFGAGQWQFNAGELARYRAALCDEETTAQLVEAVAAAKEAKCHLEKPQLKQVPDGLTVSGHARQLSLHTGLIVRNRNEAYDPAMFTPDCVELILRRFQALLPLQKWLMQHVCEV